jgi:hypothetical protein
MSTEETPHTHTTTTTTTTTTHPLSVFLSHSRGLSTHCPRLSLSTALTAHGSHVRASSLHRQRPRTHHVVSFSHPARSRSKQRRPSLAPSRIRDSVVPPRADAYPGHDDLQPKCYSHSRPRFKTALPPPMTIRPWRHRCPDTLRPPARVASPPSPIARKKGWPIRIAVFLHRPA